MPTFFVVFMSKVQEDIISRVAEMAEPVLQGEGLELVDVQYRRESGGWVLRLFIDRPPDDSFGFQGAPSGVTLDDCVAVSRMLGRVLDVEEAVPGKYTLEVSSPGLDRPLTRPEHYERFAGRKLKVRYNGPEGRRTVTARLIGLEDGCIRMEGRGQEISVPLEQAEKVNLVPEVDWSR